MTLKPPIILTTLAAAVALCGITLSSSQSIAAGSRIVGTATAIALLVAGILSAFERPTIVRRLGLGMGLAICAGASINFARLAFKHFSLDGEFTATVVLRSLLAALCATGIGTILAIGRTRSSEPARESTPMAFSFRGPVAGLASTAAMVLVVSGVYTWKLGHQPGSATASPTGVERLDASSRDEAISGSDRASARRDDADTAEGSSASSE